MIRILVLEDDDHFRRVLADALGDEGYSVASCASGDEAVNKARQEEFALIVSDIKMKGMDGLGAVSLIQSLQPEMSSLVITGFADTVEQVRADNLCLDGFLKKPFDLDVFLDRVEALLKKQASLKSEVLASAGRLKWLRWINEREGNRLDKLPHISWSELIRITRSLSCQLGIDGFETERLLSGQLWFASRTESEEYSIPVVFRDVLGPDSQGLLSEASSALSTLYSQSPREVPESLLAMIEDLKDRASDAGIVDTNLLATAQLLFQRGDYDSCEKALNDFFASELAFGRNRIKGQVLRAHLFLRSERPEKARQTVRRMIESARQDGPFALSEACLAAGLFLLQQGAFGEAIACYREAGQACLTLNFKQEAAACLLTGELLEAPKMTRPLAERLIGFASPSFHQCLASFRSTFNLVLRRWDLDFDKISKIQTAESRVVPQARVELYSLGGFKVLCNGQEVLKPWWRSSKARQLFCYLALDRSRLSEESLIEQFWPGDPTKGRNNLYTAASYIRGAFRKAGLKTEPLERSSGSLEIARDLLIWHDCSELLAAKKSGNLAASRRAIALYNGSFLPDCYMDWAEQTKRQVDDAVLEMSLDLAEEALENERMSEALECGRTALSLSPCLDKAHVVVMTALYKQQRYLELVRHYESCQQTYRLELDNSPPVEVERLYHQARLLG